jgi:hypothetical protein
MGRRLDWIDEIFNRNWSQALSGAGAMKAAVLCCLIFAIARGN